MYGKLIDNKLFIAPKKLDGNGIVVYNPPSEMYLLQGWKFLIFVDMPNDAPDGYEYEEGWEETLDTIAQTWTLVKSSNDIDEVEVYNIIFGEIE